MVILWTHCRGQASDREEKRNSPGTWGKPDPKKTKNSTIEASILLKTNKAMSETKLKRTQNECNFEHRRRDLNLQSAVSTYMADNLCATREFPPLPGRAAPRKHKNSGNEAKKSLKTKDLALLNAAHWSGFCARMTPDRIPKRAQTPHIEQNGPKAPGRVARRGK